MRHLLVFSLCVLLSACGASTDRTITMAATTSTENSGLLAYLLPKFKAATGISVKVLALGTGQAIRVAERGDADVLLVHHRPSEDKFVADGFATRRYDVMYNDFVLVGPTADPARAHATSDPGAALREVLQRDVLVSRGDDSGTHKRELTLLHRMGLDPSSLSTDHYLEVGAGMGATLNIAIAKNAYALTDRATWLAFGNRQDHKIVLEGHASLRNPYGVLPVSAARHPYVHAKDAEAFVQWMISDDGQAAINAFRVHDQQVFFANASR